MKRASIAALAFLILLPMPADSQRRRRSTPRPSERAAKAAADRVTAAALQSGRVRLADQIKTLTQFLYLLGGVAKGIESADQASRDRMASSVAIEQNERNKAKVKESIRNVRSGLEKLEADFRATPALRSYSARLYGVASAGEAAESQAAAGRFDEAGRSLLKAVNQLADALAVMY